MSEREYGEIPLKLDEQEFLVIVTFAMRTCLELALYVCSVAKLAM